MKAIASLTSIKQQVRRDGDGRLSLTDLWKLAGSPKTKAPKFWLDQDISKGFIAALSRIQKVSSGYLLKIKRGKGGGTWSHELIALEYAQYLNPELAILVNQAFLERAEEEQNPELAVKRGNDRAARTWAKQGHDEAWIAQRIVSITTRKAFTITLAASGVHNQGYSQCTNAIYFPLYGGSSQVVRLKKGLSKKDNIRDNMSLVELSAVMLSENLAMETIDRKGLHGNAECEQACNQASRAVATSILQLRKGLIQ